MRNLASCNDCGNNDCSIPAVHVKIKKFVTYEDECPGRVIPFSKFNLAEYVSKPIVKESIPQSQRMKY